MLSARLRTQIVQLSLNMISPAIGVISLPILTRYYSNQAYANYATLLTIITVASTILFGRLEVKTPIALNAGVLDALCAEMRRLAPYSITLVAIAAVVLTILFGDPRQYNAPVLIGCVVAFVFMVTLSLETNFAGAEGEFFRLGASRVVQSVVLFASQIGLSLVLPPLLSLVMGLGLAHISASLVLRFRLSARLIGLSAAMPAKSAPRAAAPPLDWGFIGQSTVFTLVSQVFTAGFIMVLFVRLYGESDGGVAFLVYRVVAAGVVAASLVAEADIRNLLATVDRSARFLRPLLNRFGLLVVVGLVGVGFVYGLTPWAVSLLHRQWWSASAYVMPLFIAWWSQLAANVLNIPLMNWGYERTVLISTAVRISLMVAGLVGAFLMHASSEQAMWIASLIFALATAAAIAAGYGVLKQGMT